MLARERFELVAESMEPILRIHVVEGQAVGAGEPVVELDPALLDARVAQAEAQHERAAASLAEILRGPRSEEIREAEAQLAAAEAALVLGRQMLERIQRLTKVDAVAVENLDSARARAAETLARRDQAQAVLDALESGATQEEVEQARAAAAEAAAAVQALRLQRDRLLVRMPCDGIVDALPYHVGERPPPGAPVAIVLAAGPPHARVFLPEPMRVRLRPGHAAEIRVDGVSQPFAGKVRTIAHDPTFTPYYALNRRDRGRLAYVSKIDLLGADAAELPSGIPVEVTFPGLDRGRRWP